MVKKRTKHYFWLLPLFIALLTLSFLMLFAIREERTLQYKHLEEVFEQRLLMSARVANKINKTLNKTTTSIERFSRHLSLSLETTKLYQPNKFKLLFEKLNDQSTRSKKSRFNGDIQAGLWLPNFKRIDKEDEEQLLLAKHIIETYGQGAKELPFVNTWFMPSDGGIVIYWPNETDFIYNASRNHSYADTPWLLEARPDNNPTRKSYWTPLILDPIPQIWMLSAVSPLYINDQWAGSVGHDIPLDNLINNTKLLENREGSEFILISDNNDIVASNVYHDQITSKKRGLKMNELTNPQWSLIIDKAYTDNIEQTKHTRYHVKDKLFTVSYIQHKGWLLLTSMPVVSVKQKIADAFSNLRHIIIATILMGIVIISVLLRRGKRRKNKLLEEQSRYKNLVDNVPSMVYQCNIDSQWSMNFLNGSSQSITGYSPDELLFNQKISFEAIIYTEDRELVRNIVEKSVRNNGHYEIIYRIVHKCGDLRWVLERGIINTAGESVTLEGVITDISKLKEAELSLKSMNQNLDNLIEKRTYDLESTNTQLNNKALALESSILQLKETQNRLIETEKIAALDNLVVGMSHELNTPLGNLLMLTSILETSLKKMKGKYDNNQLQKSILDDFFIASKVANTSLFTNINKLVILSERFKEIAIQDVIHKRQLVGIKNEVNKALSDLSQQLQQNNIKIEFDILHSVTINAYPLSIYRVFSHLINNSIEHGFKDMASGNIHIWCEYKSQSIVINYSDNGHGISKELQNSIFEPFSTNARGQGHVGLGMNIVFNLVMESMQGTIKCSHNANGATFVMTIPTVKQTF